MASSSTQSKPIDMTKEKDWPAYLGMLDWDDTSIIFTKRSLIEFLKYTGTTVDPNFANISKLPRYAKFSKVAEDTLNLSTVASDSDASLSSSAHDLSEFKPSRRVRTAPGGPHSDIFNNDDEGDALSLAPPKEGSQTLVQKANNERINITQAMKAAPPTDLETSPVNESDTGFKPSRRVRTTPGGPSSMANLWDPIEDEEFKPTRRVRDVPGGHDNLSGIL